MLFSMVGFHRNLPYRIRQIIGPVINRLARTLGQPSYHVPHTEYVGTIHLPREEFEAQLGAGGFTWMPISLYHRTPTGTSTDGSWVYRSSLFADRQLHVILFTQSKDRVDIYAHNEYNWVRHPLKHVKQMDIRRKEGADQMRRWLDAQGLDYTHESILHRKAAHLFERLRETLFSH